MVGGRGELSEASDLGEGEEGASKVKLWVCLGKSLTLEEWFVVWAAWGGPAALGVFLK